MLARNEAGCEDLSFYFTDEIGLRAFNTTTSDRKKGIFKIPKGNDKKMDFESWSEFYEQQMIENHHEKVDAEKIIGNEETVTMDDFELLKLVGSGGFGKVFLVAKKKTHELFA